MCILEADVELRAGRIGRLRARHGDRSSIVKPVVELRFEPITRTTRACPLRATALYHEAGLNTMECQSIIKVVARKFNERRHGHRSIVGEKSKDDVAFRSDDPRLEIFGLRLGADGFLGARRFVRHVSYFRCAGTTILCRYPS